MKKTWDKFYIVKHKGKMTRKEIVWCKKIGWAMEKISTKSKG